MSNKIVINHHYMENNKLYKICYHHPTIQSSSFFHTIHPSEKPAEKYQS